jgi:hypothetical protein
MPEDFSQDELTRSYAAAAELDAQAARVLGSDSDAALEGVPDLCGTWRTIRPIIEGASNLFLIPANIRRALKTLITVVDGFCGGNS